MRTEGCGLPIVPLKTNNVKQIVGFAFVDNCDLLQSLSENEEEDIPRVQQCLDTWVEALRSTGGTLVPEKVTGLPCAFIGKRINGR